MTGATGFIGRHLASSLAGHGWVVVSLQRSSVVVDGVNEAIIKAKGHLFPLGWMRLLWATRRIRTASFKLLGVLPEHRSSGLHAKLVVARISGIRAAGYRRLEASLIDERNGPMRHIVETAGMEVYKRYRVYERAVP